MKKILQIDGGGIRGVIPSTVIANLEKQLDKPLCDCFDLITGTSTGAIIGGGIAAGVPAAKIASLYLDKGEELFTPRTWFNPMNWLRSKYDRDPFINEIAETETENLDEHGNKIPLGKIKLSDLNTRFMATAFNLCSQRTHFIKSWFVEHEKYQLVDVISWSALSAVHYFGKINVDYYKWCHYKPGSQSDYEECRYDPVAGGANEKGAVFQDGGQGANNNTLGYVLTEIMANEWTRDEEVYILSLGAGNLEQYIPYNKAKNFGLIRQGILYLSQAREESLVDQVLAAIHVSIYPQILGHESKIKFKRIDKALTKKEYGLDKAKYIDQYKEYGDELSKQITADDLRLLQSQ
ncbi:MAG: patatin [Candidatus Parabeggiatoa sp. nov. 2]|nr:MAG: hypothetical protein B6247_10750 [Beggiatoa sp. 4572_84]RKZ60096.1 MAG: patatin [Gammaproteobacteria bacterium]